MGDGKVLFVLMIIFVLYYAKVNNKDVNDTELITLISTSNDLIVFFRDKECDECDAILAKLLSIGDKFSETLNAKVVQAVNSNLVRKYNPSKEPSLVYFRKGVPLLYDGDGTKEHIVEFFTENREPAVKQLSDETFEHLTQAATGATTGDWFILFYSNGCVECGRLFAIWEGVGATLKQHKNVARINKSEGGNATFHRFSITEEPTFIFLRNGKAYRYSSKTYTIRSFVDFAESGFQAVPNPENVPEEYHFTEDLSSYINSKLYVVAIVIILAFVVWVFKPKKKEMPIKNKKSK